MVMTEIEAQLPTLKLWTFLDMVEKRVLFLTDTGGLHFVFTCDLYLFIYFLLYHKYCNCLTEILLPQKCSRSPLSRERSQS